MHDIDGFQQNLYKHFVLKKICCKNIRFERENNILNSVKRTQVLIAGAGPVGSTAAYYLAKSGIDVVVVEAAPRCMEDLRASTMHAATLEMLDKLGVVEDVIAQGLVAPIYQYRDRQTQETFSFDLTEISDATKFPFRLQCEQHKLARLLTGRMKDLDNVQVLFNHRIVHLEQTKKSVVVSLETPFAIEQIEADYVIGADGANSIVRKWLNTGFDGFTYPEKFLTLSTKYPIENHFENLSYVNYISDPNEWMVVLKVPSVWRVQISVPEASDDKFLTSDEHKTELFDRLMGDGASIETYHRTVYRVHQRVVKKYNHGRVLLIGDAAHLNNPLGGFGMNSGIHDAWNVCEKLIEILQENAEAEPLLDRFDRQRRTIMNDFIQAQTIRNKKMMEAKNPQDKKAFRDEMESIHNDAEKRREYLLTQSMLNSLKQSELIT
ncbi:FAD-dependent oxidoreductase [Aliiglaciecola sp. SL4]|uniref:FAD-dependent oxidoreductase n=1 Tax=Aliiglaciecola sp. SL4 TaxID=3239806 RepID=UPI00355B3FEC